MAIFKKIEIKEDIPFNGISNEQLAALVNIAAYTDDATDARHRLISYGVPTLKASIIKKQFEQFKDIYNAVIKHCKGESVKSGERAEDGSWITITENYSVPDSIETLKSDMWEITIRDFSLEGRTLVTQEELVGLQTLFNYAIDKIIQQNQGFETFIDKCNLI